jgi:hypothetical protein
MPPWRIRQRLTLPNARIRPGDAVTTGPVYSTRKPTLRLCLPPSLTFTPTRSTLPSIAIRADNHSPSLTFSSVHPVLSLSVVSNSMAETSTRPCQHQSAPVCPHSCAFSAAMRLTDFICSSCINTAAPWGRLEIWFGAEAGGCPLVMTKSEGCGSEGMASAEQSLKPYYTSKYGAAKKLNDTKLCGVGRRRDRYPGSCECICYRQLRSTPQSATLLPPGPL